MRSAYMSPRITSITRNFLYNQCNHVDNKKYAQIHVIRGDKNVFSRRLRGKRRDHAEYPNK